MSIHLSDVIVELADGTIIRGKDTDLGMLAGCTTAAKLEISDWDEAVKVESKDSTLITVSLITSKRLTSMYR